MFDGTNFSEPPVVAAVRQLRARLADPDHWTKGAYARHIVDGHIDTCGPEYEGASRFCMVGALMSLRIGKVLLSDVLIELAQTIIRHDDIGTSDHDSQADRALRFVLDFNDNPTTLHEEVIAVADDTITRLLTVEAAHV